MSIISMIARWQFARLIPLTERLRPRAGTFHNSAIGPALNCVDGGLDKEPLLPKGVMKTIMHGCRSHPEAKYTELFLLDELWCCYSRFILVVID